MSWIGDRCLSQPSLSMAVPCVAQTNGASFTIPFAEIADLFSTDGQHQKSAGDEIISRPEVLQDEQRGRHYKADRIDAPQEGLEIWLAYERSRHTKTAPNARPAAATTLSGFLVVICPSRSL